MEPEYFQRKLLAWNHSILMFSLAEWQKLPIGSCRPWCFWATCQTGNEQKTNLIYKANNSNCDEAFSKGVIWWYLFLSSQGINGSYVILPTDQKGRKKPHLKSAFPHPCFQILNLLSNKYHWKWTTLLVAQHWRVKFWKE